MAKIYDTIQEDVVSVDSHVPEHECSEHFHGWGAVLHTENGTRKKMGHCDICGRKMTRVYRKH